MGKHYSNFLKGRVIALKIQILRINKYQKNLISHYRLLNLSFQNILIIILQIVKFVQVNFQRLTEVIIK
ncbi:hypothetical protein A0H76_2649 [Hepatospora eriocheir]|uniref:Uncharacterized protein n=1 Tax=Hepatospora eriocheir TaxID=1081669 RepID=A0A1X0QF12_9MICR|nr:hypothetical protein HERIO_2319 [Hepatospora eriocheir]ORD98359.1 hypothetical protein A0H76_2649 [Hepatospora eriocheir]